MLFLRIFSCCPDSSGLFYEIFQGCSLFSCQVASLLPFCDSSIIISQAFVLVNNFFDPIFISFSAGQLCYNITRSKESQQIFLFFLKKFFVTEKVCLQAWFHALFSLIIF